MNEPIPAISTVAAPIGHTPLEHDELHALAEAGQAILQAQMDAGRMFELIYEYASHLVDTSNFHLGLFEDDDLVLQVWVRDGERQPVTRFPGAAAEGIVGWLRRYRRPLLVRDFQAEMDSLPARPSYESQHPPRAAIFVPILAGDLAIGSLAAQSFTPEAYNETHLRILFILANQAGVALVNSRLFQVVERRARQLQTVAEVSRKVVAILDLDQLLTQVVNLIQDRFGYYHVQIFLVDQGSGRAYFRASSGHRLNEMWRERGRFVRIGQEGIIGWVAAQGEPLLANDVSQEARYVPDDPRLLPATRAELAVPLKVETRVLGVLDVQSTERDAFSDEDLFILKTLADQIAVAVEDARLYQRARDEAAISTALLEVANAIGRPHHLSELATTVARLTPQLAGVDRCTILLLDQAENQFEVIASHCLPNVRDVQPVPVGLKIAAADFPLIDRVARTRSPLALEEMSGSVQIPAKIAGQFDVHGVLAVPLIVQHETQGVILVDEAEHPHAFSGRQIEIVRGIASQFVVAIEGARLLAQEKERVRIGEELRLAHLIQASFLPESAPDLVHYDVNHHWQAAREMAGDFYDYIALPGNRLGLVIADVSDKGVPAAMYMSLARTLTRVVAADRRSPARVLRRVNELLPANSRSDMFVSMWYGVLDPQRGEVSYANAGHAPPLFVTAHNGRARFLRKHGLVLGVLPHASLYDGTVRMRPGDVLVLYTDGITDMSNPEGESFDAQRLLSVVVDHHTDSAQDIIAAICESLRQFAGGIPPADDLTLIVIKRRL